MKQLLLKFFLIIGGLIAGTLCVAQQVPVQSPVPSDRFGSSAYDLTDTNQVNEPEPVTGPLDTLGATQPTAVQAIRSQSVFVGPPAVGATAPAEQKLLRWGPIIFHPHIGYTFTYGNGIQSSPGQGQKTLVQGVSPGLELDLGRHWTLDYTPTATFYSDSHFRNTVDHAVSLNGRTVYQDWTLGFSQGCILTSEPLMETASQTDQEDYSTLLDATYQMSTALSLSLGVAQDFHYLGGFTNTLGSSIGNFRDWSTMDWLNYQWSPSLSTSVGAGFGYTAVDIGSDMTYEQVQGRFIWHLAQKVSASVSGGAEIRQFLDSGQPDALNPIFSASLNYQPFKVTTLSLTASRIVRSSYYQNQATKNTSVNASIRQRLLGRLYLTLSGGYANTSYQASTPGIAINREDNYSFFRTDLSTGFLTRATVSVFYSTSRNSSNMGGFGYSSDQVGFNLAYRY